VREKPACKSPRTFYITYGHLTLISSHHPHTQDAIKKFTGGRAAHSEIHYVDKDTGEESKKGVEGAIKMLTGGIAAKRKMLIRLSENRRGTRGRVYLEECVHGLWVDRGLQTVSHLFWKRGVSENSYYPPLYFVKYSSSSKHDGTIEKSWASVPGPARIVRYNGWTDYIPPMVSMITSTIMSLIMSLIMSRCM
jgi:hypothetical protein